jgi:hypothetical protein
MVTGLPRTCWVVELDGTGDVVWTAEELLAGPDVVVCAALWVPCIPGWFEAENPVWSRYPPTTSISITATTVAKFLPLCEGGLHWGL